MRLNEIVRHLEDNEDPAVLEEFRAMSDEEALEMLAALAGEGPEIRLAIPLLAKARLGTGALPILEKIALHDRNVDVRDAATDAFLEIAPSEAQRFWRPLRRRLGTGQLYDAELAGWRLFELGDPDLRRELDAALNRWPESDYIHKSFRVLKLCLAHDPGEIETRIRGHDHESMKWLARAARELDTQALRSTLVWASLNAPDEQCRRYCASRR